MKQLVTILLIFSTLPSFANSDDSLIQSIDSLETIVKTASHDTTIVKALREWDNIIYISDPKKDLELLKEACSICEKNLASHNSKKVNLFFRQVYGNFLNDLGIAYINFNDYNNAIIIGHKALKHQVKYGDSIHVSRVYNNLGVSYGKQGEHKSALKYYFYALDYAKDTLDPVWADAQNNIALVYVDRKMYPQALSHYLKSLSIYEQKNYNQKRNLASTCNEIGEVYSELDKNEIAFNYLQRALDIHNSIDDKKGISKDYYSLAHFYLKNGEIQKAIKKTISSLKYANLSGSILRVKESHKLLYELYKSIGKNKKALVNYEIFISLQDSIESSDSKYFAYQQDLNFVYQKKKLADSLHHVNYLEIERTTHIENEKKQKIKLIALLFIISLIIIIAVVIYKSKQKSEQLLLNILPKEVAQELKKNGFVTSKLIESTTVLFTDFKGFTALSEKLTPKQLVMEINHCFSAFDQIMSNYGIEKIKTIGDSYMAAGGLPTPTNTHVNDVLSAAIDIRDFMADLAKQKKLKNEFFFEIRIGVHTGPVVAGIVGLKKFQYDIWGDTVNIASRMESSGSVSKVNISESTYELVKNSNLYSFTPRGKIKAKGKGEMEMYYIEKRSVNI